MPSIPVSEQQALTRGRHPVFVARVAAAAAARCILRRMRASLGVFRRRLSPGPGSEFAAQFLLRGVSASDDARLRARLGRRVYVSLLLLPVLPGDGSPTAVAAACRRPGLSPQTLRRWRRWWQETFAGSAFWRAPRGRLRPGCRGSRAVCWTGSARADCRGGRFRRCSSFGMTPCSRLSRAVLRGIGTRRRCITHDRRGLTACSRREKGEAATRNLATPAGIPWPGDASAKGLRAGRRARIRKRLVLFPLESSWG